MEQSVCRGLVGHRWKKLSSLCLWRRLLTVCREWGQSNIVDLIFSYFGKLDSSYSAE